MPANDQRVFLEYEGKISEDAVLAPVSVSFASITCEGVISRCRGLTPNGAVLADNFYALHDLIRTKRKATLIYLDPPFATGMEFHSRQLEHAYKDRFGEAAYIEFMRRRIILMHELLDDAGSLYLHIGHQMVGQMRVLMDEVFGRKNFRNLIVRRKCSSKNFTKNDYANIHDYILFYSRSANYKWHQPGETPDGDWITREYPKMDSRGRYKLVPVHAPGTRRGETGMAWRGVAPPAGKHWQYAPAKLDALDAKGEIHWSSNGNPRRKVYLPNDKKIPLTDYWPDFRDAHHQSVHITGYPTEKNIDMLKTIVLASSDPGDLVVDPFCGSGTALQAADTCDRQWIGIDDSFAALKATLGRLRHGLKAMGDYVNRREQKAYTSGQNQNLFAEPMEAADCGAQPCTSDFLFYVDADLIDHYKEELNELAAI